MVRMGRGVRKNYVEYAIRKLVKRGKYDMFTKGEIARAMGCKSSSYLRDLLREMVGDFRLVSCETFIEGYNHKVEVFGIAKWQQKPLPEEHVIVINGVKMMTNGEVIDHA